MIAHAFYRLALCLLAVALVSAAGCKFNNLLPQVPYDSAAGLYEEAALRYEFDAGKLQVPVAVARVEAQTVSYRQIPSSVHGQSSIGRLEIVYPHPRSLPDFALARVKIESRYPESALETSKTKPSLGDQIKEQASQLPGMARLAEKPAEVAESWELDIPRAQLDRIVFELYQTGYFQRELGKPGPANVAAQIDGRSVEKPWPRISELDALMLEVRSHGRLLEYKRSESMQKLTEPSPASIAAYQAYANSDAQQSIDADRFVAGGYTIPAISADPKAGIASALRSPQAIASAMPIPPGRMSRLPAVAPVPTTMR